MKTSAFFPALVGAGVVFVILGVGPLLYRVGPNALRPSRYEPWLSFCALVAGFLVSGGVMYWVGPVSAQGLTLRAALVMGCGFLAGFCGVYLMAWLVGKARR